MIFPFFQFYQHYQRLHSGPGPEVPLVCMPFCCETLHVHILQTVIASVNDFIIMVIVILLAFKSNSPHSIQLSFLSSQSVEPSHFVAGQGAQGGTADR